jgi:hypothetical protein
MGLLLSSRCLRFYGLRDIIHNAGAPSARWHPVAARPNIDVKRFCAILNEQPMVVYLKPNALGKRGAVQHGLRLLGSIFSIDQRPLGFWPMAVIS